MIEKYSQMYQSKILKSKKTLHQRYIKCLYIKEIQSFSALNDKFVLNIEKYYINFIII